MSFVGVAAGIGAVGGILKIGKGLHQDHLANQVVVPEANYDASPYAKKMLAEATMRKNGRMPGASAAEGNIEGAQANTTAAIDRNATSGSQALALLAASQGTTDSAFNSLSTQEAQYRDNQENNYNNALGVNINEGDKVYQDAVRKRQEAIGEKTALRGAANQNAGGGMNDITNNAFMYGSYLNGQKTP